MYNYLPMCQKHYAQCRIFYANLFYHHTVVQKIPTSTSLIDYVSLIIRFK